MMRTRGLISCQVSSPAVNGQIPRGLEEGIGEEAEAQAPAGHGVSLAAAIQQYAALRHALPREPSSL